MNIKIDLGELGKQKLSAGADPQTMLLVGMLIDKTLLYHKYKAMWTLGSLEKEITDSNLELTIKADEKVYVSGKDPELVKKVRRLLDTMEPDNEQAN
jgi:hypothetical protein